MKQKITVKLPLLPLDINWILKEDPVEIKPYLTIPVIDINEDTKRQVIVDKEKDQYLGHVTTVLMEDGKTILRFIRKDMVEDLSF
jgi:hypothetical protein